ncbi:KR domain-containing protein [Streptomyces sp. FXJ1.4098]|nr:KR domain-containing protein [Streptomyces sp. FXJ1.4098]
MVAAADVTDARAMGELKEAVLRRFGAFDGVLHCAGTTGPAAHRSVSELGDDESAWHFGPKLYGPLVLEDMLADQRLDFALLSSSISAILGGLGFGAYASANAVLDAFAQRHHCADRPWSSINWDAWLFTQRAQDDSGFGAAIRELALTPEEGRRAFDELLNTSSQPHLVVSTADVEHRRRLWAAGPAKDAPPAAAAMNDPACAIPMSLRAAIRRSRWRRSGRGCWASRASGCTTTSSSWAGVHCSASRWCTGCAKTWPWRSR